MTDPTLRLRDATRADAQVLFDWRNDEETRRVSRERAAVDWNTHVRWLEKTLAGGWPRCVHCVAETDAGELVGMVRADERDDGLFELSITVAPGRRWEGIGKRMVLQFVREKLMGKPFVTCIKKGANPASEALARALGLAPFSEVPAKVPTEPPMVEWR